MDIMIGIQKRDRFVGCSRREGHKYGPERGIKLIFKGRLSLESFFDEELDLLTFRPVVLNSRWRWL